MCIICILREENYNHLTIKKLIMYNIKLISRIEYIYIHKQVRLEKISFTYFCLLLCKLLQQ